MCRRRNASRSGRALIPFHERAWTCIARSQSTAGRAVARGRWHCTAKPLRASRLTLRPRHGAFRHLSTIHPLARRPPRFSSAVRVCVCACMHAHECTHMHAHTHTRTHAHTHTRAHTCAGQRAVSTHISARAPLPGMLFAIPAPAPSRHVRTLMSFHSHVPPWSVVSFPLPHMHTPHTHAYGPELTPTNIHGRFASLLSRCRETAAARRKRRQHTTPQHVRAVIQQAPAY